MLDTNKPVHKGMVLTLMDIIDYDGHTYVYFVRSDQEDDEEQELYITEYEETYQDIIFNSVTNEVLLNELYDVFMEENGYNDEDADEDADDADTQDGEAVHFI